MNALNSLMNPLAVGQSVQQNFMQGRAMRANMETENALSKLAMNPQDEQAYESLARFNPQMAMGMQQQRQEQQRQQQEADLTRLALDGDPEALKRLATINFDRFKVLDAGQKAAIKQEIELFGQAAMDILSVPPEQRAARVQQYAAQFGPQYPEIAEIVTLPPAELEGVLRAAVAEAGVMQQMIAMEQPKYMAIPEGGTLVDTRNPQAVASFGASPQPAQPAPTGMENTFTFEQVLGALNSLGPQGTADWIRRNGITVRVNSPQEAKQLPRGTRYIDPNGVMRVIE